MENAHPIEIVTVNSDHSFSLSESSLYSVLLQDDIKDRSVVVVSVAGAFRKGKSFLLGFFLRYLYAQYRKNDVSNWLGKDDEPLVGFTWRGGSKKITTGILMWSDIFTLDYKNGDKIAIILLDTQGTFDIGSTVKQSTTIFSLSTLLSSVQCYNLMNNIQEDDLMNLNLFTEFGRLARQDTGHTPFQRLQFIVRDWSFPYEHRYGSQGGNDFLNSRLEVTDSLQEESQMSREEINSCFSEVECFLMPHPGFNVIRDVGFNGSLRNIDKEFKKCLKEVVPLLLAPENLITKKINGEHVKAHELAQLFPIYLNALQSDNDFNPRSIYMGLAEFHNMKAVNEAELLYRQLMIESCSGKSIKENRLNVVHRSSKEQSIRKFQSMPKAGTVDFIKNFMGKLDSKLEDLYFLYKFENERKQKMEKEKRNKLIGRVIGGIGTGAAIIGALAIAILK